MKLSEKKIKVLFRHRSMEMGGVEKVILSLLNNLDQNKFEMTVCLNINQGELRNDFPPHVRKVFLTKGREDFSDNQFLQKIQLLRRKMKLQELKKKPHLVDEDFLNEEYDIEIAPTYNDYEFVLASTNKNSKKIGWLHSDISLEVFNSFREDIVKNLLQFDYIIYGSRQCKAVLDEKYPDLTFPPGEIILNAIPIEEIKTKAQAFIPEKPDVPLFVSVGRLHFRKGYHTLLEAHKKLLMAGFPHHIEIIGDGEDFQKLSSRIKELEVQNSFKLMGLKMNPYPHVKNADFYIMPSESEGWPLIIAETLLLQKPILATAVGGVPELISHKKTGYLTPYSEEGLYAGMKAFLTDKALISSIKSNLANIEKQFDNQQIFKAVESVITRLQESKNL